MYSIIKLKNFKPVSTHLSSRFFSTIVEEPIKKSIVEKLTNKFTPSHLEVINESYMHSVPRGSETHFKVIIVSNEFDGKTMISQHRSINETLKDEFKNGVHALSIHSTTPLKWEMDQSVNKSPGCMGGSKKEKEKKNNNN
ncbi:hypothetical protein DICPUDRAFT_153091 [Dictyostelium purpureum]|uniref:BolA family protein n=1 Tax=Dictyostelium purpureum TaxID=5786 RepID=F0ZN13_DICPU|nr:uncharacterized protein DICPUDRAFT_153091 [Dictyostelium purpureum]EGC34677.1 hypothetical protein DICPUDRAFT_153091 [Dictyostelium purpureum]|eukprot:XP_003288814.1 hypothetical protein DICPUDRAFT_153091 [Dictyostelium purpureum]